MSDHPEDVAARRKQKKRELPWPAVVVAVILLAAAFGWGFMAAEYARDVQGWSSTEGLDLGGSSSSSGIRVSRASIIKTGIYVFTRFVVNGFRQLPRMPAVIGHVATHRLWMLLLIAVVIGGLAVAGVWLTKLDKALESGPSWKGKGTQKIATPKADDDARRRTKKRRALPPPGHDAPRRRRPQ
jgi:hypothetical protein